MNIRVLGAHHIEVQDAKHTCFLLDDRISIDAGSVMTSTTAEEQQNIQAFLITHRHLDHIRDLPGFGLANLDYPGTVPIYSLQETLDSIFSHVMGGDLYPDFSVDLTGNGPKYERCPITPGTPFDVEGYSVLAIPVPHPAPAVGYIIQDPEGKSFACCGDTGGGLLPFFQDPRKPDPIFLEVTFGSKAANLAKLTGHLTPELLKDEIIEVMKHNLPIPRLFAVHMNPSHEEEIAEELVRVSSDLGVGITIAKEGMIVEA